MALALVQLVCKFCGNPFPAKQYRAEDALFCSRRCAYEFRKEPVVDRFWRQVDKRGPDDCWLWLGELYHGYGRLFVDEPNCRRMPAHKFSYILHYGLFLPGLFVMHRCNNKPCVNPRHLRLGTQADNSHDAARDGLYANGENNVNVKLTPTNVKRIRALEGAYSQRQLAHMFGTT